MAEVHEQWMCVHCFNKHEQLDYCAHCGSEELGCVNKAEDGFVFFNKGAERVVWNRFAQTPVVSPCYVKVPLLWRLGFYRKVS